jgi:hypothetical protein
VSAPGHAEAFDAVLDEQPADWDFFEVHVTLDDALRLTEARVALARANARPQYGPADHDFAITVAHTHGRGARAGVVRSALRTLDMLGITGRTWGGITRTATRPAPAHRHGP